MTDTEMLCDLLSTLTGETIAADATAETKIAALAKAKGAKAPPAEMSADAIKKLHDRLDTFAAENGKRDVLALVAEAQHAGKKISLKLDRLVAMGAEGAKEYLDSLDAGVVKPGAGNNNNLGEANKGKPGKGDKVTDVFSGEQINLFRRNGCDPEDMLKAHNERVLLSAEEGTAAKNDNVLVAD